MRRCSTQTTPQATACIARAGPHRISAAALLQLAQWCQSRRENCSANRLEGHHVQSAPIRSPPPRPQPTRHARTLTRAWSDLPALRRQQVLLVLSQILAKTLPSPVLKGAAMSTPEFIPAPPAPL